MITLMFFVFMDAYCKAHGIDLGLTKEAQSSLMWLVFAGEILWWGAVLHRKG